MKELSLATAFFLIVTDVFWITLGVRVRLLREKIERLVQEKLGELASDASLYEYREKLVIRERGRLTDSILRAPQHIKMFILASLFLANCVTFAILILMAFGVYSELAFVIGITSALFGILVPFLSLLMGQVSAS